MQKSISDLTGGLGGRVSGAQTCLRGAVCSLDKHRGFLFTRALKRDESKDPFSALFRLSEIQKASQQL